MNNKKAQYFQFSRYHIDQKKEKIEFWYQIGFKDHMKINFCETLLLDKNYQADWSNKKLVDTILFNIHLICGISYFKLTIPNKIIIKSGHLSKHQVFFWNQVYRQGLGQYYFENNLNPDIFCGFPISNQKPKKSVQQHLSDNVLLAFSGGKDSILSYQLLKKSGLKFSIYFNYPSIVPFAKKFDQQQLFVKRTIDKKLTDPKYKKKFNHGHIPITAIWHFIGLLACCLYNYRYLVFSNEKSSDYGNVKYKKMIINHQWSKSQEFETLFTEYSKNYISDSIICFSLLRPYYEINIIKKFAKYHQYFNVFTSCNRNFLQSDRQKENLLKDKLWCGNCPKCAFVFLCLACFIKKDKLLKIFNKNLLDDKSLLNLYLQLIGQKDTKPFECVGTIEESMVAFGIVAKKSEWKDDFIIRSIKIKYNNYLTQKFKKQVFSYGNDTNIPKSFRKLLGKD